MKRSSKSPGLRAGQPSETNSIKNFRRRDRGVAERSVWRSGSYEWPKPGWEGAFYDKITQVTEGKEERFDQHSPLMSRESYDKWLESLPANLCTFCEWRRYQIVLRETDSWIWILNRAPYWRYHTMFVPKRHVEQMSELSVVEIGELFSMYESAVEVFRDFEHDISSDDFNGKFIFFWRFRGRIDGEYVDQRKIDHFHLHLAPDKERMFDPILVNGASNYDYVPLLNQAKSSHRWLYKD